MQRFYSVVVEKQDGVTEVVPARGEGPGDAFRQAKGIPGVRRVGKVTEIREAAYESLRRGERPAPAPAPARVAPRPVSAPAAPPSPEDREKALGNSLSGPRVVAYYSPRAGERPFAHLQPPPERVRTAEPEPVKAEPVKAAAPVAKPQAAEAVASQPAKGEPAAGPESSTDAAPAYRILKSRRREGDPYLLQRGHWSQSGGKRVFNVEWEKGFETREKADEHIKWVEQTGSEMSLLNQHVA